MIGTSPTPRVATIALLTSGLLWGLTWMPLRYFADQQLTGLTLSIATYGVVGVLGAPWLWVQRDRWTRQWGLMLVSGLACGLANACFVTAIMFGEIARAMLLFYLTPLWGVLGGRLFFQEPLTPARVTCLGMALGGAVLVLGGPDTLAGGFRWMDLIAIGAGFFYAVQNLASRAATQVPIPIKVAVAFAGCGIVAAALLPVAGHEFPSFDAALTVKLGAFTLVWLIAAMWTQIYGVSHMEAGRAAVLVVFELVAAVVSAMIIAGERLDPMGWVGAALIVSAALVEARTHSSPAEESHP
ncbi:MAG: DMT family transporter [Burkholderiales bacterium]|nr:DMT family transporter [Burkholderiales bacterium]